MSLRYCELRRKDILTMKSAINWVLADVIVLLLKFEVLEGFEHSMFLSADG